MDWRRKKDESEWTVDSGQWAVGSGQSAKPQAAFFDHPASFPFALNRQHDFSPRGMLAVLAKADALPSAQ
jgi:hypothetical protein